MSSNQSNLKLTTTKDYMHPFFKTLETELISKEINKELAWNVVSLAEMFFVRKLASESKIANQSNLQNAMNEERELNKNQNLIDTLKSVYRYNGAAINYSTTAASDKHSQPEKVMATNPIIIYGLRMMQEKLLKNKSYPISGHVIKQVQKNVLTKLMFSQEFRNLKQMPASNETKSSIRLLTENLFKEELNMAGSEDLLYKQTAHNQSALIISDAIQTIKQQEAMVKAQLNSEAITNLDLGIELEAGSDFSNEADAESESDFKKLLTSMGENISNLKDLIYENRKSSSPDIKQVNKALERLSSGAIGLFAGKLFKESLNKKADPEQSLEQSNNFFNTRSNKPSPF